MKEWILIVEGFGVQELRFVARFGRVSWHSDDAVRFLDEESARNHAWEFAILFDTLLLTGDIIPVCNYGCEDEESGAPVQVINTRLVSRDREGVLSRRVGDAQVDDSAVTPAIGGQP